MFTTCRAACMVAATVSMICIACAQDPGEAGDARIDFDSAGVVVAGLPIPVQITLQGPVTISNVSVLDDINPIRFKLIGDANTYYVREADSRIVYQAPTREPSQGPVVIPAPQVRVDADDTSELSFDLSQLELNIDTESGWKRVSWLDIVPGDYVVEVETAPVPCEVANGRIRILKPNEVEMRIAANIEMIRGEAPPFGKAKSAAWQTALARASSLSNIDRSMLSDQGRFVLAYHLLVYDLVHAKQSIDQLAIDESSIAAIPPPYRVDALILRYEIERAAKRAETAEALRTVILSIRPTAVTELDRIEGSDGLIKSLRDCEKQ